MFMTLLFRGWTLRAMMVCSAIRMLAAGSSVSTPACGAGRVSALAFDGDAKAGHGSAERSRAGGEMADRHAGFVVQGEHFFDAPAAHHPVIAHGFGAGATFFRRLKDQHHRAVEIARLGEPLCGAQQHRCMSIMAACMHPAGNLRGVGQAGRFLDRQRVHIGAQPDHSAGGLVFSLDDADDTADADALGDAVAAKRPQLCRRYE